MHHPIQLSQDDCRHAAVMGATRRIHSRFAGHRDNRRDAQDRQWESDIEGAMAEAAFARHLGLPVDVLANETFKGPDVAGCQVRWTRYPDGRLIVRQGDDPGAVFVLVTGTMPNYRVCGWAFGRDAMDDRYLDSLPGLPPSWLMPQGALRDMADLKGSLLDRNV